MNKIMNSKQTSDTDLVNALINQSSKIINPINENESPIGFESFSYYMQNPKFQFKNSGEQSNSGIYLNNYIAQIIDENKCSNLNLDKASY